MVEGGDPKSELWNALLFSNWVLDSGISAQTGHAMTMTPTSDPVRIRTCTVPPIYESAAVTTAQPLHRTIVHSISRSNHCYWELKECLKRKIC